jgi:predicted dehydrogenase
MIGSGFADDPLLAGDVYTHAEAYVRSASTELVGVCDQDERVARACAERWGLGTGFTDVESLLDNVEPEIVSICTPDDTHSGIARQALKAPSVRAILCEKPLATSLEEGEELLEIARERGKMIAVAYVRRYASNVQAVRQLLQDGSLGRVTAVSGWYGKGLLHNGSHWFDLLRMLAGEVDWVEATDQLNEDGGDPSFDVTLGLASGLLATLRAADSSDYTLFEMDILTCGGRIAIRSSGHAIDVYRAKPSMRYSGYTELAPEPHQLGDMGNLMLHAVDDLADAMSSGRDPLCTGEDGLSALRIARAARYSAANGCRIEISA